MITVENNTEHFSLYAYIFKQINSPYYTTLLMVGKGYYKLVDLEVKYTEIAIELCRKNKHHFMITCGRAIALWSKSETYYHLIINTLLEHHRPHYLTSKISMQSYTN